MMDQRVISDIASDAAALSRELVRHGIRDTETQVAVISGAMPAIARYEAEVLRPYQPPHSEPRPPVGGSDTVPM